MKYNIIVTGMSWAASGMSMMPGLAPRPQHHIVQKTDFNEKVESSSNAMFISVRECKGGVINVLGKTGKISLEKSKGIKLCLDSRVVGGVLEIIKCEDVYIQLVKDGEVRAIVSTFSNFEMELFVF